MPTPYEMKQVVEQVHSLKGQLNALLDHDEFNNLDAETQEQIFRLNDGVNKSVARYKGMALERKERLLAAQRPPVNGLPGGYSHASRNKSDETRAIERWIRGRGDHTILTSTERALIDPKMMTASDYMDPEKKVMMASIADTGGFWAGTDISQKIIQKMFLISPIRALADVQPISGEKLLLPSEGQNDTSVGWTDEQQAYQASPDVTVGLLEIYARELSGYIKITNQMLEDQAIDIEAFLIKRLSRQFALREGQAFISGNGVARPEGVITNALASTGPTDATHVWVFPGADSTTHTILPSDIINLMHKVKSPYRATSTFCMSNATVGALRLFRDTQKRPIWQMFGNEFVETIFGRPIVEMPDLVDPASYQTDAAGGQAVYATGNMPIIFGSFGDGYQIVDRIGVSLQVLRELFAIQNQVAYLGRQRVGGKVVLPEAFSVLKMQ